VSDLIVSASSENQDLMPNDSLSLGGGGTDRTIKATPPADSNGTATINVTVSDGDAQTTESYLLTVTAVNDAPVIATNEPLPVRIGAPQTIEPQDLTTTDVESDPSAIVYTVLASNPPSQGRLLVDGTEASSFTQQQIEDGKVQYEHTSGTTQDDDFGFTVTDQGGTGLSVSGTFEIIVSTNSAPTARADTFATDEDQTLAVTDSTNGLLANDDDPDRDPLQASIVTNPANGDLNVNGDGTFTYDPAPNVNGTDRFDYRTSDGAGGADTAAVVLNIRAVNDTPRVATNTGLSLDEGTSQPITTSDLSASDVDDAASDLTFSVATAPSQGRLLVGGEEASSFTQQQIADGAVQYEHTAGSADDDQFVFDLTDDDGAGPTGRTFAITVRLVNSPPTAADDEYVADQGRTLAVTDAANGVLGNDSDPNGDPLEASVADSPANGTLTLSADGTFEYTPSGSFSGTDTFTYQAADGKGGTDQATVEIQVRPSRTAMAATRTFPDPEQQQSFRLVALPGAADTPLGATLSGQRGDDWTAFREDGATSSQTASRAECGDGTSCRLQPGTGYWLVSRSPWTVDDSLNTVPLEPGSTAVRPVYRVPLQDGWNIVSNPVERDVPWSAVQAASGTSQPLWRWDGSWQKVQTFASAAEGTAYYFMDDGIDELVLPFPGLSPRARKAADDAGAAPDSTLALHVVQDGDTASTVRAGLRPGAEIGLDRTDRYGPPGYFGTASLRFVATEGERRYTLAAEHAPPGRDGYAFDLRLRAPSNTALTVVPRGTDAFAAERVALVRRSTGRTHDLRADSAFTVVPRSSTTRYRLLVGSEAFVQEKRRELAPSTVKFLPNYPNPFHQATTLEYALPERQDVRIEIYDVMGRRVRVLVDEAQRAGFHQVQWRVGGGASVASGVYFARLSTGSTTKVERLVVVH
jgi:hypothetical protein